MCLLAEQTRLFGVAPILTEWKCMFEDNPFRPNGWSVQRANASIWTVAPVSIEQMCLFRMIMHIQIEQVYLFQKASSEFLYKGQNFIPKRITQKK